MPLNDSFNRKGPAPKVVKLSSVPTADDLNYSLSNARQKPRRPEFLAWQANEEKRMLQVTCGLNPGSEDARWVLRDGYEMTSQILWTHDTVDAYIIHTLIADSLNEQGPAAAIPEFLRPGAAQVEPVAQESVFIAPREAAPATPNGPGPATPTSPAPAVASNEPPDFSSEKPGSIFADRYEIMEQIGRGATSAVYKARQTLIDRIVALKVLHPHMLTDESNKKRFEMEAKATSTLNHVNLVLVQDFGSSPLGRPFIVMDYVDGPNLDDILVTQGRLGSKQFIDIFSQCCRGLAHAHKKGVIHRDIKPSNIKLTRSDDGEIVAKVLDFGIAKSTRDENAQKLTEVGCALGSPIYMSPEQCRAEEVDHRSDIYSLGVSMYAAVTGILPFKGKDTFETLFKHIYEPAPAFSTLGLDFKVPSMVETVVQKALQKLPADRYQTMEEFDYALQMVKEQMAKASVNASGEEQSPARVAAAPKSTPSVPQAVATSVATPAPKPTEAPAIETVSTVDLLQRAQLVTEKDVEEAIAITKEFGGEVPKMLIAKGKLEKGIFESANRCQILISSGKFDLGRAIILINYCVRTRLNFDEAVDELGWDLE